MSNNKEGNRIEQAKEVMQNAQEAAKLAANVASGNILEAAKSILKMMKSKEFKKYLKRRIIKMIITALIPIMIAAFFFRCIKCTKRGHD